MLMTIAIILVVIVAAGNGHVLHARGFLHLLLVLAIIAILIRVIQGRSPI